MFFNRSEKFAFKTILQIPQAFLLLSLLYNQVNGQKLTGTIRDSSGKPVPNVQICLFDSEYLCETDSCTFPDGAVECTRSNKSGVYQLKKVSSSALMIFGKKDNLHFYRRLSNVSLKSVTVSDTLRPPGSLHFTTILENQQNNSSISVKLLGTPYCTRSQKDGAIRFDNIPAGSYLAMIKTTQKGYSSLQCSLHIKAGFSDIFKDTLKLTYTPAAAIENLQVKYDSSLSKIHLSWDHNGTAKTIFTIYRKINGSFFEPIAKTSTDSFIDSTQLSPKETHQILYFVNCDNTCYPSDTIQITVKPKENKSIKESSKKQLHLPSSEEPPELKVKIQSVHTAVNPLQRLPLRGVTYPEGTSIKRWEWSINGAPFAESSTSDTVIMVPLNSKELVIILKGTSDKEYLSFDTSKIEVKASSINVAATGDSTAGVFEKISLSAITRADKPVVSLSWDIGNTGRFTPVSSSSIQIGPFGSPRPVLPCIVKVIDQSGESALDTLNIRVDYLWEKMATVPALPERKSHVIISHENVLYIIGGSRSDVWSSEDGLNWKLKNDSAPFGPRYGHSAVSFNGKLWVAGGKIGKDSLPGDIWTSSDGTQWQKVVQSPFLKRYYHSMVLFQHKILITGGINDSSEQNCLNDSWFSSNGINWEKAQSRAPFVPRYAHGSVTFKNSIFLIGGKCEDFDGTETFHDVWKSVNGRDWQRLTNQVNFPENQTLTCFVYADRIWAIGGFQLNSKPFFSTVCSSFDGVTWEINSDKLSGFEGFHVTGAVFNNQIIMSPSGSTDLFRLR